MRITLEGTPEELRAFIEGTSAGDEQPFPAPTPPGFEEEPPRPRHPEDLEEARRTQAHSM